VGDRTDRGEKMYVSEWEKVRRASSAPLLAPRPKFIFHKQATAKIHNLLNSVASMTNTVVVVLVFMIRELLTA